MYPIVNYPYSSTLNEGLYDLIIENLVLQEVEDDTTAGRRTEWDLHNKNIKDVDLLTTWIKNILPEVLTQFIEGGEKCNFSPYNFKITHCWGLIYNKGHKLMNHNHFPFTLSFVYGVRMPRGSAPLIVGNEKINLKEGQCIFFPANTNHRVPYNHSEGRCVVGGNILYTL